jgi:Domain of unknown function (DUF4389)
MSEPSNVSGAKLADQVRNPITWTRLVHMLVLAVAMWVSVGILWTVTVIQFLSQLFTGRPFPTLTRFGASLAAYLAEVAAFLTYASEYKPFPYAPLGSQGVAANRDDIDPARDD